MYKNYLKEEIYNLVSEGQIGFYIFEKFMQDIKTISEQDAKLIMEVDVTTRKTAMSWAGLVHEPVISALRGGNAKQIAGKAALGVGMWAAYRGFRAAFERCTRKCGVLKINNAERQNCMMKCKTEYSRKKASRKK